MKSETTTEQRRILLVEDDLSLGETLTERLSKDYEVVWARSKAEAHHKAAAIPFLDLIILDVGLPDGTGFEFAQEFKHQSFPALVFLTAQGDAESRLQGYELGAEEYIPKPFHLRELLLRVEHVLKKHAPEQLLVLDEVTIDFTRMSVKRLTGGIEYPPVSDMKVLKYLVNNSPRAVSRDEIMNAVWGVDKNPSIRTIDNTIVRLRSLLGRNGEEYIRSVRGTGYQFLQKEGAQNEQR